MLSQAILFVLAIMVVILAALLAVLGVARLIVRLFFPLIDLTIIIRSVMFAKAKFIRLAPDHLPWILLRLGSFIIDSLSINLIFKLIMAQLTIGLLQYCSLNQFQY